MSWIEYLKVVGAIGTAFSVVWAIFIFRRSEDRRMYFGAREQLGEIRALVSELDALLSEAEFSRVARNIVNKIRELKPDDWSLAQFTEFLSSKNDDYENYVSQAIHEGRNESIAIERVSSITRELREMPNPLKEPFPIFHATLQKLIFYINRTGSVSVSARLFKAGIGNPEAVKEVLAPNLEKYHEQEVFYFHEIINYISAVQATALQMDQSGQKTFDQAEIMISVIVETISRMNDSDLRKSSSIQKKNSRKLQGIDNEHAAEDALEYLQLIRDHFTKTDWDRLVAAKTTLINLVKHKS